MVFFIRLCSAFAASIAVFLSVSLAQEAEPVTPEDSGLNELDLLSRSKDDPFPQFGDEVEREPVSVTLRALDKITARFIDIEVDMNTKAEFGSLEIVPRYCDKRPPEDFPETTAFLEIFDKGNESRNVHADVELDDASPVVEVSQRAETEAERPEDAFEIVGESVFRGWMFASSPALNPLEHAVYDVWVIDCKTVVAVN